MKRKGVGLCSSAPSHDVGKVCSGWLTEQLVDALHVRHALEGYGSGVELHHRAIASNLEAGDAGARFHGEPIAAQDEVGDRIGPARLTEQERLASCDLTGLLDRAD